MKRHSLADHQKNVERWWFDTHSLMSAEERRTVFFIAYERWLNDRVLLTEEEAA